MGRGRYPARLKVSPPPPELAARYLHTWNSRALYAEPEQFPPISSPGLFGNDHPLEIDIGCATGELVVGLADERPEVNFLGIDIVAKPLWRAVERAVAHDLANTQFLQADMHLAARLIPPGALQTIYLHFPAPLLANRQRRRRLIEPELLGRLAAGLISGGRISFVTDQEPLYHELLNLLPGLPQLELRSQPDDMPIKSHYHVAGRRAVDR